MVFRGAGISIWKLSNKYPRINDSNKRFSNSALHPAGENAISVLFQIRRNLIVVIVFLSNLREFDRSDSFLFDYEPNGISFGL